MTPEMTILTLVTIWQMATLGLASFVMTRDNGPAWNLGPRDQAPKASVLADRLKRAANNGFEGLALFAPACLILTVTGQTSTLTTTCAVIYLIARVLYVPAYALGLAPWRSLIWAAGSLSTVIMLISSLFSTSL